MGEVFGIEVPDLPAGYVPLEVVATIKCLDEKGEPTIMFRSSDGLMAWEAVGMLTAASDTARADLQTDIMVGDEWEDQDGDGTDGLGEHD